MAEIQFNVNMDLVDKYVPAEDITIPQEDNLSVKFTYSIFNREVAEDLTGATNIVVSYVKPDGHIVLQSNGTLELPNKVSIVANAQAFTYVGKVYTQVQYKKGAQTFNTRQAFFWVEKSGTSCTTVASSDFAPYLDNVIATGEMLNGIDLQALIDSKQTAENAQDDIDALTPRVTTLETDVSSLKSRVTAVETKNTQQDNRLTSLENQQGTFATSISNLQASDTAQNTRLTNLESGQATQDNRLTAIETKNTTQDSRLTSLETAAGDIPTMKSDITAIKGVNTTQDNRLSTLETAKTANDAKNATQDTNIGNNATAISALQTSQTAQDTKITNLEAYQTSSNTRITAVEAKNTTQDSRLLALEQAQPDLEPIEDRLTAVETKNTAQDTRLTDLETAKAANDTKNTQQDSRLTSLENGASSLATTVANNKTAQDTVNTSTNSSLTSLTTRVTATETKNNQQDTRLDAIEEKNTSQDTKIATLEGANSVIIADIDTLESSVGGHEVRLDDNDTKNASQDSLIASNSSAISSLTTTVNNNQTGMNTRVTALETAKTANDTKNTQQDNRLTALENNDLTQDGRLTTIEGVNTTQNTRLTAVETKNAQQDTTISTNKLDAQGRVIKAKNESIQATRTNGNRRCMVSFISDDSYVEDYTILKGIFEPHNIPCGTAVISSYSGSGNPNQLNDTQMAELYNLGWEFSCHTHNHPHLPTLTKEQQDNEFRLCKEYLENKGYKCDYVVYPFGEYNQDTLEVAKKYFRFGFTTGASVADYPVGTYAIKRVSVGAYFDGPTKNTLEYYKSMFDEAYVNNKWVIFMLHPHDPAFDTTQQQHLRDLITYIKGFSVPILAPSKAYDEMGNMLAVGDGVNDKFVITNDGEIRQTPKYSSEVLTTSKSWRAGTGSGILNQVNFIDESSVRIRMKTTNPTSSPSVISVGKNIWGGLKAANDIITAVGDNTIAYFTIVDGKRCIALKGGIALQKVFFSNGFIDGLNYTLSGSWRRDVTATGNGGTMRFKHSDGTYTGTVHAGSTTWTDFSFGSTTGKTVSAIEGTYGSNGNIVYIDLDTLQVEIGIAKSAFEPYKESRLNIATSLLANDLLTFENGRLYKNAESVSFTNNLKSYQKGTFYISDGLAQEVYITYPMNTKAAQNLSNEQVVNKN